MSASDRLQFFDAKYRAAEGDPWSANGERMRPYYAYVQALVRKERLPVGTILDVGCGEGSLSLRLGSTGRRVIAVDISPTAISTALRKRDAALSSSVEFRVFDLLAHDDYTSLCGIEKFGGIVCSQVLMYYQPDEYLGILRRLAGVLAPGGKLFIVTNGLGPRINCEEMASLVTSHFSVLQTGNIEHHYAIVATTRRPSLCMTIRYEASGYSPESRINHGPNFLEEVLDPTDKLVNCAERFGCRLSFFIEVAQIAFWEQYLPEEVERLKEQIRQIFLRGHDVQLSVDPGWLTRFGVRYDPGKDQVTWSNHKGFYLWQLSDQELDEVLPWAHDYLRGILAPIDSRYKPSVFWAVESQTRSRAHVFKVLESLGYQADSSVWLEGYLPEDQCVSGYNFRYHRTRPHTYRYTTDDINVGPKLSVGPQFIETPIFSSNRTRLRVDHPISADLQAIVERGCGHTLVVTGHSKRSIANLSEVEKFLAWAEGHLAMPRICNLMHAVRSERARKQRPDAGLLAYYKRTSPTIESILCRLTGYNQKRLENVIAIIDDLRENMKSVHVLDFGCGTGELFTVPLALHYKDDTEVQITGYDMDQASVMRGQAQASNNSLLNLQFTYDLGHLSRAGYDLVCSLEVLQHTADPHALMEQLASLAGDGAAVYVTVPNGFGPATLESWCLRKLERVLYASTWLLKIAVRLRRLLLHRGNSLEDEHAIVTDSLHPSNNFPSQSFRRRDLREIGARARLRHRKCGNTTFLLGPGMHAHNWCLIQRADTKLTDRVPGFLASGWWFEFERPASTDHA